MQRSVVRADALSRGGEHRSQTATLAFPIAAAKISPLQLDSYSAQRHHITTNPHHGARDQDTVAEYLPQIKGKGCEQGIFSVYGGAVNEMLTNTL